MALSVFRLCDYVDLATYVDLLVSLWTNTDAEKYNKVSLVLY